jgi:hypothetical protein
MTPCVEHLTPHEAPIAPQGSRHCSDRRWMKIATRLTFHWAGLDGQ